MISLSIIGFRPFCQARSKVGAMTKKVMNSDRLISTRLAGALCKPRPDLRKESATMNRVKLVTMIRRPGATDRTVSIATSWMMRPLAVAPPAGIKAPRSTVCASPVGLPPGARGRRRCVSLNHQSLDHQLATLPLVRAAARSLRSWRMFSRPIGPSS